MMKSILYSLTVLMFAGLISQCGKPSKPEATEAEISVGMADRNMFGPHIPRGLIKSSGG